MRDASSDLQAEKSPRAMSISSSSSSGAAARWCPEFHPSRAEFASFATYIRTVVEPQCADIGVCKIIPPRGWFARTYEALDCVVERPVSQHVAGKKGIFNVDLVERKTMNVQEFQAMAESLSKDGPTDLDDTDAIERLFWKGLRPTMDPPVYGADIVGSLFGDADALSWNLNKLDTILRKIDLPGVTRAMLYFGMWKAMFAFHTEDMDLYSINYVHTGKPKFWYAVPPNSACQLERAAQAMFPEKHHACSQFLRHKTSLVSPARLREFGVPFYKAYQKPGEFVITFPGAYHQGFNLGFNIAEAVNFATLRWVPRGIKAKVCKCSPESVRIDMDAFLPRLFEPSDNSEAILGSEAWIFSCKCGKYSSSDEPSFQVDEQWFECSECKIWAHVRCVHPSSSSLNESELPASLLCHRCLSPEQDDEAPTLTDQESTDPAAQCSRKRKNFISESPSRATTRKSPPSSATKRPRRPRLVKGTTIHFEDSEAKVVAVEGNSIRVHYKGQSIDSDEWLDAKASSLHDRIVSVSAPQKVRKPRS